MPKKRKISDEELTGAALVKETARRIRVARTHWKAHRNGPCRFERERALKLYERLEKAQKDQIPQELRIWLRYRSEKYFGDHRTPPGSGAPGRNRKR
ncbi:MAG: Precorrin-3B methylase [Verrucomicrobiota bacterium]